MSKTIGWVRWNLFYLKIHRINKKSRERIRTKPDKPHTDNPFELPNSYCRAKLLGHADKWWNAGYGAECPKSGIHHLYKVMWWCAVIIEGERRKTNTDMRKR